MNKKRFKPTHASNFHGFFKGYKQRNLMLRDDVKVYVDETGYTFLLDADEKDQVNQLKSKKDV